jgi:hypothetical protein
MESVEICEAYEVENVANPLSASRCTSANLSIPSSDDSDCHPEPSECLNSPSSSDSALAEGMSCDGWLLDVAAAAVVVGTEVATFVVRLLDIAASRWAAGSVDPPIGIMSSQNRQSFDKLFVVNISEGDLKRKNYFQSIMTNLPWPRLPHSAGRI